MVEALLSPPEQEKEEEQRGQAEVTVSLSKSASLTFTESDSGEENDQENIPVEEDPLFQQVELLYSQEKLLEAARLLRTLLHNNSSKRTERHKHILTAAQEMEDAIADIVGPPNALWNRQGTSASCDRPTVIYTKFDDNWKLTCRIETPIEASLLVPLLSVLNETDLYDTWIPSWRFPKIGVSQSTKLHHTGKANQLLQIVCDVPWPLRTREVIVQATAVDEIDEQGYIVIRLNTVEEHPAVHEKEPDIVRVDFEGAVLFRACPLDHELRVNMKNETGEPLVLVSFKM